MTKDYEGLQIRTGGYQGLQRRGLKLRTDGILVPKHQSELMAGKWRKAKCLEVARQVLHKMGVLTHDGLPITRLLRLLQSGSPLLTKYASMIDNVITGVFDVYLLYLELRSEPVRFTASITSFDDFAASWLSCWSRLHGIPRSRLTIHLGFDKVHV